MKLRNKEVLFDVMRPHLKKYLHNAKNPQSRGLAEKLSQRTLSFSPAA